jgi:hypothetical protein
MGRVGWSIDDRSFQEDSTHKCIYQFAVRSYIFPLLSNTTSLCRLFHRNAKILGPRRFNERVIVRTDPSIEIMLCVVIFELHAMSFQNEYQVG